MSNKNVVGLGSSNKKEKVNPDAQKMIYMNIEGALVFIAELNEFEKAKPFVSGFAQTILQNFQVPDIREKIFKSYGVANLNSFKDKFNEQYNTFTDVFGTMLWG